MIDHNESKSMNALFRYERYLGELRTAVLENMVSANNLLWHDFL